MTIRTMNAMTIKAIPTRELNLDLGNLELKGCGFSLLIFVGTRNHNLELPKYEISANIIKK